MDREELVKKYNLDLESLEREQVKLAKSLSIKDKIDFSLAELFGAVDVIFIKNKMLCAMIVCNRDYEIVDRAYSFEKTRFPYVAGFRAYRELPVMVDTFNKLSQRPDVMFIPGQGIMHFRLGLASHFSLSAGVPSIGVSNSIIGCEVDGDNVMKEGHIVGKVFISKSGSRPMYISPGNDLSIKTALELCGQFINLPHKFPEPMHLAGKYGREVKKELTRVA
ncbi:hypothetical protein GOV14_02565 [Candidatus Pacearchaeota archaeon]|nr:hypothetical protein [Candidatus Pacearchaeota archaeon]